MHAHARCSGGRSACSPCNYCDMRPPRITILARESVASPTSIINHTYLHQSLHGITSSQPALQAAGNCSASAALDWTGLRLVPQQVPLPWSSVVSHDLKNHERHHHHHLLSNATKFTPPLPLSRRSDDLHSAAHAHPAPDREAHGHAPALKLTLTRAPATSPWVAQKGRSGQPVGAMRPACATWPRSSWV